MMPNIGITELVVILAIVLILFGAKKLPEVARSLGSSVNAFKKGLKEEEGPREEEKKNEP